MEIIIATKNKNKLEEIIKKFEVILDEKFFNSKKNYLEKFKFLSLIDLHFIEEIDENGKTFYENSKLKSDYIFSKFKKPTIGEDSGLVNLFLSFFVQKYNLDSFLNEVLSDFIKKMKLKNDKNFKIFDKNKDNIFQFFNYALKEKKIFELPGVLSKRFCFNDNTEERNTILLEIVYFLVENFYEEYKEEYRSYFLNYLKDLIYKSNFENESIREIKNYINKNESIEKLKGYLNSNQIFDIYKNYQYFSYFTTNIFYRDEETQFSCNGYLFGELKDKKGEFGFGYDPIFYIPELKKNLAELNQEEKNKVSHRQEAFEIFLNKLIKIKYNVL